MRESTNVPDGARGDLAFCEECLLYGTDSVLLRICLSCGHVGCAGARGATMPPSTMPRRTIPSPPASGPTLPLVGRIPTNDRCEPRAARR